MQATNEKSEVIIQTFIPENEIIRETDLGYKRPGSGIPPNEMKYVLGRVVKKALKKDELISWDDLI